jgi:hypothetical protein
METLECIICENCRNLVYGEGRKAKKCPNCHSIYTGKEVGVPITGEIHLESRIPERNETEMLKNTVFKRKKLSPGEIKLGIILILCGIIIPPIAIAFGIHVFSNYIGPGVIFWGGGAFIVAIGAIVAFFVGFYFLLREPRKKSLVNVFEWVWSESYGEIFSADSKNEYKNAYGSVIRCVPDKISDTVNLESLKEYLLKMKNYCRAFLDEKSKGLNLSCQLNFKFKFKKPLIMDEWTSAWALSNIIIENENNLGSYVKAATGSFTITKTLSCKQGDYECKLNVASVSIKIYGYYIKSGKYWFPYDLMPKIKEMETFDFVKKTLPEELINAAEEERYSDDI